MKTENLFALVAVLFFLAACSSNEPKEEVVEEQEVTEKVVEENDDWVVHETGFGDVHLHKSKPAAKPAQTMEDSEAEASTDESMEEESMDETAEETGPITHDEFQERIKPVKYIAGDPLRVEIAESTVPLVETETITAYNSHGKEKGTIEVIHDSQTGEIVSIAYTHKDHRDQYNVSPGMSAKDVKEIRKDLKHMKHRGKYYLYSDVSNVMYVLDVKDNKGHQMTEVDFDEAEVDAIVWKDKKHHTELEVLDLELEAEK